jgi:iron(III) transport system permease protein
MNADVSNKIPKTLLLPAVFVVFLSLLPIGYLFIRTFGSLSDLIYILFRLQVLLIFVKTALLVVTVCLSSVLIALLSCWLVTRTDIKFKTIWSGMLPMPLVVPSYVGAFIIIIVLGPKGMLQKALEPFGILSLPDIYGFKGAWLTLTFLCYPYIFLTLKSAMENIDPALQEIAQSSGYSYWKYFLKIELPLLRPSITSGSILVILYTLSDFGAVSLLRYQTFTWSIYLQYQAAFDRTLAAGLSLILALIVILILYLESKMRKGGYYYRTNARASQSRPLFQLNKWQIPASIVLGSILLIGLIIPLLFLMYLAFQGVVTDQVPKNLLSLSINSVMVSVITAISAFGAGSSIALITAKYKSRVAVLLENASYIGFGIPGIVIALSLVFFGANYANILYQTIPFLIFGYTIMFMPALIGAFKSSLLTLNPRIEESAKILGESEMGTFRRILLPITSPGIYYGMSLVFLLTIKELPVTLILGPLDFGTLATALWNASEEAFFLEAAISGVVIIVISIIPIFGLNKLTNERSLWVHYK